MNIFSKKAKIFVVFLITLFASCATEESLQIQKKEASFVLQEPSISNVFLNFGLPANTALTLTWADELTGSTSYDVEMALDAEFKAVSKLGSATGKSFSISVMDLNAAISKAGATNFKDIAIFTRINTSSKKTSNTVVFTVTTYPVNPPVITSPTQGGAYELLLAKSGEKALTIKWTDAALKSDLGVDVNYTVEAALAGTSFATPVLLGQVKNALELSATHSDLNAVALGLGLPSGKAGNVDVRVTAKSTNQSGIVLSRTATVVTLSVTPYSVSFPNLYFVGDATSPGWDNNNNNTLIFRNQDVPNNYIYTGYFKAGAFKLLETKGNWQPQWGTNDGTTLAVNPGGGNDPGVFSVGTAGYYTYNFTTVGQSGSFTITPFDATTAKTYTSMGIIGAATANGWGSDTNMTKDANNPHLWYITNVTLTADEMKFRANADWAFNWGDGGSKQPYGKSVSNSGNLKITTAGVYDVWFNDLDGRYLFIAH